MEILVDWAGFLGAWLLVGGPLLQGSIELWELGRRGPGDVELRPLDSALWLVPPVLYLVQLRRIRRWERQSRDAHARGLSVSFVNRATGWFAIALGASLIAVKESWELATVYGLGIGTYWLIIAVLIFACFANVAIRMWRLRKQLGAHHSSE